MFAQLQKLILAFALLAFVSSQFDEEFECFDGKRTKTTVCATGQNLCVRASKCRSFKSERDPSFFLGACVWNKNHAINFCDSLGPDCECKICNTSKCNDDERIMKNVARKGDDESNETKPSIELFSAESNPSSSKTAEEFQCYTDTDMEPVFCPYGICFGGIDCSVFDGKPPFHFLGACVRDERIGQRICKDFGCANCTICQGNKCNAEDLLRGDDESNETKDHARSTVILNNTSTMPSTELPSTESTSSSSSEFSSTISNSMVPIPTTPSGAISAFSNGPKWESSIPVAILTASTLLLTVAIL